jgi:cytoskeletal protein CcmA (bactofilin family)
MDKGVTFEGHCTMLEDARATPPPEPAAKPPDDKPES